VNRRRLVVAIVLPVLVLVAGLATALVGNIAPATRVYSVGEVATGLARHPSAWIGRSILVRGVAVASSWSTGPMSAEGIGCFTTASTCPLSASNGSAVSLLLRDDAVNGTAFSRQMMIPQPQLYTRYRSVSLALRVRLNKINPLIAFIQHIPLVGRLISARPSGRVPGNVLRVYRIQIQPMGRPTSCLSFMDRLCTDGLVVDAYP